MSPSFTENNTHNLTPATFDTQKQLKVHYPAVDILNVSGVFASLEEKGSQTAITVNDGFCLDWISSVGHKRASPLRQTFIPRKAHTQTHKYVRTHTQKHSTQIWGEKGFLKCCDAG